MSLCKELVLQVRKERGAVAEMSLGKWAGRAFSCHIKDRPHGPTGKVGGDKEECQVCRKTFMPS